MNIRSSNNPFGSFTEGTDKRIGDAFPVIEAVHAKLSTLTYLAENINNIQLKQVELRYVEETRSLEWRYADEEVWHILVVYKDYSEINSTVLAAADITTADAISTAADRAAIADMLGAEGLHVLNMSNPHNTTKAQVGLGNVDNTPDIDKPVSNAQGAAIAAAVSLYIPTSAATAAGMALLDDVSAAAQRNTLGLGTLATQSGSFSGSSSGTNTGDNAANTTYDSDYRAANFVVRTDYAEPTTALATGLLKNTTTTGAHTIAVAGTDYTTPSSTETQTNKSFSDSTTYIVDASDVTKRLQFQAEQVTTATTQTATVQDISGPMAIAGMGDVLKSPRVGELGSAAYIDVGQIPRNYFTELITADKTLTASDAGKVFLVSGTGINITLPAASTCSSGWMVTIYNDNSSNSPVAHASASANLPFGQNMVTLIRQGSDTLNGQTTQIHGFATIIGPRQSADIWLTSTTGFAAKGSDRIGWKDLTAEPHTHGASLNDPAESTITGAFYKALEFTNVGAANQKEVYISFHIGHDYMMGTRIYPHVHWLTNNTDTTVCRWGFQYSVAKGHQQQAFFTEGGGSTTVYVNQTKSATAYMHHIAEVSDADAIPPTNIEPDSIITMRVFRDSDNAADTFTGSAWVINVDCHYMADRHTTPNKAPSFFV